MDYYNALELAKLKRILVSLRMKQPLPDKNKFNLIK